MNDINHQELATYVQLLHHQSEIAESLKAHLKIEGNSALSALLDITIGFARDLRDDFHVHFWDFFDVIMDLINHNHDNVELIEGSFRCLAVFFKLQWRIIVKSLRKTLQRLFPLFCANQNFVRRFVAEVTSFLLRKAANVPKIVSFLVEKAKESEDEAIEDGVIQLLFNTIKGAKGQFHSRSKELLNDFILAIESIEDGETREMGVEIMENVMAFCVDHTKLENSKVITDVLCVSYCNIA